MVVTEETIYVSEMFWKRAPAPVVKSKKVRARPARKRSRLRRR